MAPSAGSTMTMRSSGKKQANGVGSAANGGPVTEKSQNESGPRDETDAKHRDFFWTYTEEPHRTRRLAIIKAHPEVTGRQLGLAALRPPGIWLTLPL